MKELDLKPSINIEVSVKEQKQVEYELIGILIPFNGHTIYEINEETLEITKAKFGTDTLVLGEEVKNKIYTKKGHSYISALNIKNALKKYHQGKSGGKPINEAPLCLTFY